jgi:hypothetical protein
MTDIVPFSSAQLPAYLKNRKALASVNKDVVTSAQYPKVSIKGKVFTLVKDNEKKMLTSKAVIDGEEQEIPAQSMQLNVLRANKKARVYFAGSYVEGESDNTRPTCHSHDGIAPLESSAMKQAPKCGICPHAVWGSKIREDGSAGEGTECNVVTRLAITAPDQVGVEGQTYLLAVPAGSRKNFDDAVKVCDARGLPYNAVVFKVSFDPAAPSPKLVFKPVGLLPDESFGRAQTAYETDLVKDICGLREERVALPAPVPAGGVNSDELDAALAVQKAVQKAAAIPTAAKVTPRAAPAPVDMEELGKLVDKVEASIAPSKPAPAAPAPAPVQAAKSPAAPGPKVENMDGLLDELQGLLDMPDDA